MKAWRRTSSQGQVVSQGNPPLTLTITVSPMVDVGAAAQYVGSAFALIEESASGVGGWTTALEAPISADPQAVDLTGFGGPFFRAFPTLGDAIPIAPASNVIELT